MPNIPTFAWNYVIKVNALPKPRGIPLFLNNFGTRENQYKLVLLQLLLPSNHNYW